MIIMSVVVKVYENKATGQRLINIPKNSDIKAGDYVKLVKVKWVEEE